MTGKSAEARSAAYAMSRLLCAANGYAAWREVVLGVCTEQVSRELLRDLEPLVEEIDVVGVEEGEAEKENAPSSLGMAPAGHVPVTMYTPAKSMPAHACGSAQSQGRLSGRRSLGAAHVPLRHYLKERDDCAVGLCSAAASPAGDCAGDVLTRSHKRVSLSGARKGAVTPVLVLQRTLSSPAVGRSAFQVVQHVGNVISPSRAYGCPEGKGAGVSGGKGTTLPASPADARSGKHAIELPIGEEAAKLLEDWCVA